ncbi:oxygen-dependent choline dehydrogenase-like isoform X1 [Tachypleus tridentatus]|uniref:oxygen-dependent choline dehydrogenase-like isoform X1 n=1 Tax=Tachypleus tridentatus TaxID=6853 RepID=UPI003FD48633
MIQISSLLWKGSVVGLLAVVLGVFFLWPGSTPGIKEFPQAEYDFIIIGAGTAGSVVARRLVEGTNYSVLIIEAGSEPPWISSIPLLSPSLQMTSVDWGYKTVSQARAMWGLNDQQAAWPRGKVLGGSSSIYYLIHTWGAKQDFNHWEKKNGCKDWSFQNVLPFFQRSEEFTSQRKHTGHRGYKGPLHVSEFDASLSPVAKGFLESARDAGLDIGDLNGELELGAMPCQSNIHQGKRWTAFQAYLKPVLGLPNLDVVIETVATRLIFEGKRAIAVKTLKIPTADVQHIRARKEIILSLGTIGSPHLLLLSGIGPQKDLQSLKIPVVASIPAVGQGLVDHLNVPMYFHLSKPVSITTSKVRSLGQMWNYFVKGKGVLAESGIEALLRAPMSQSSLDPALFLMLFNLGSVNADIFAKIANFKDDTFRTSFPDNHNDSKEGFIILASCLHARSKGEIYLTSSDPSVAPVIDPHYLEEDYDVKCTIQAMKLAARLAKAEPFRRLGVKLHLPDYSECSQYNQTMRDLRYLECWVRTGGITGYHPMSTCRMGTDNNPDSVVDSKLRVRGVKGLRIVDGSVFPSQTSGPPHAAIIMVAERAVEFIKEAAAVDI